MCASEGVCFPPDRGGHWSWEAEDQPRRRGKGLSTGTCRRPQAISCVQVRRPGESGSDAPRGLVKKTTLMEYLLSLSFLSEDSNSKVSD